MLQEKRNKLQNIGLIEKNKILWLLVILNMIAFLMSGCNDELSEVSDIETTAVENVVYPFSGEDGEAEKNIEAIYGDIYAEMMAAVAMERDWNLYLAAELKIV